MPDALGDLTELIRRGLSDSEAKAGGASLVWFPIRDAGAVSGSASGSGTGAPGGSILRRVAALRRYLAGLGVECWTKPDPSALGVAVPEVTRRRFPGFAGALERYGAQLYCIAHVPAGPEGLSTGRSIPGRRPSGRPLPRRYARYVNDLPRRRRFVVLQGPPGTGKTRLAELVRRTHFGGHGMTVQFCDAYAASARAVGSWVSARASPIQRQASSA